MKANEIELLRYLCARPTNKDDIDNYWNTMKIAMRNGYKVKDSQMWMDYIKMLECCGKDILHLNTYAPQTSKKLTMNMWIKSTANDGKNGWIRSVSKPLRTEQSSRN